MRHVDDALAGRLEALIDEYWSDLNQSLLADASIEDYFYFAWCFVRWAGGEFEPGARLMSER